jgi:Serine/threonine protein phosphatase
MSLKSTMNVVLPNADLRVFGAMLTEVGKVRPHNEDTVLHDVPRPDDPRAAKGVLALVADGMGGHAAGEVASDIAARVIDREYYAFDGSIPASLEAAFRAANEAIFTRAQKEDTYRGMGTTCTALVFVAGLVYLANVGDSRAYILRDGAIHQLSQDDSLVGELVRSGAITAEEAHTRPDRNVILRALGTKPQVTVAVWNEGMPLRPGDRLVVCSDGLCDLVDDAHIRDLVADGEPLDASQRLIDAALQAGGHDNISVGVFVVGEARAQNARVGTTRPIRLPEQAQ